MITLSPHRSEKFIRIRKHSQFVVITSCHNLLLSCSIIFLKDFLVCHLLVLSMENQAFTQHVCDNCGGVGTNRCGGCGAAHYCGKDCQSRHWKSGHKNVCAGRVPKKPMACGLCGNKYGPFMKTPCCGRVVCDTEGSYQMNSYQRLGQCARSQPSVPQYLCVSPHRGPWRGLERM